MKFYLSKIILFGLPLILGIYLLMPTFQLMAQDTRAAQPDMPAARMEPVAVDAHIAGMSDEQIRQAYKEILEQGTAGHVQRAVREVLSPDPGEAGLVAETTGERAVIG